MRARGCVELISTIALLGGLASASPAQSPSPANRVTIYRDEWGVPHIYAQREEDGYYGWGYAQAEDQLEVLLTFLLLARGERAGAFGAEHLESDFAQRQWRHVEEAKAAFPRLPVQLQRNYHGYVAGVERFMRDHRDRVPAWAPRLEPWDPVAHSRSLLWLAYHAGDGLAECRAAGVRLSHAVEAELARREALASNEWVLAPWRQADGSTMVLSDPHGGVDGAFVYELRLKAGGLDLAGFTVGALPLLAHNRQVAWGMTTGAPDVSDCYEIAVDSTTPTRYRFDGKVARMIEQRVTVEVKGKPPVTRTLQYTRHNGVLSPVVGRSPGKAYVVSTPFMPDAGIFDDEVYRMVRAGNVREVRDAMRTLGMFPQNVMAGDADGGSFYVRAGKAPRRPAGFNWKRPVPGNGSETAWLGVHPLDDLVQVMDPPTGYMQNNNIGPDRMFPGSPLTPDRYPIYIYNDAPGRTNSRGRRVVEALSRAYAFTLDDAIGLALDEKWMDTERWLAALRAALDGDSTLPRRSPEFRRVADRLSRFDGVARAGSSAALAYWLWWEALFETPGGFPLARVAAWQATSDPIPTDLAAALIAALERAVTRLGEPSASTDRTLGDLFRIGRGGTTFPIGGVSLVPQDRSKCEGLASFNERCVMTLRAYTAGRPDSAGLRHVEIGSRLLRLVVFGPPFRTYTLHNYGQSERRDSPHYNDQARLSSERRLKQLYFDLEELRPHIRSELTLDVIGVRE